MTTGAPSGDRPRIVVAISPRSGSPEALRWAVGEAERRGAEVEAVMAWRPPRPPSVPGNRPPAMLVTEQEPDPEQAAQERLSALVAAAVGPDADVRCRPMHGGARSVLLRAATGAEMLVLDAPRVSKISVPGARLLAPRIMFASPCPVVLMPAGASGAAGELRRAAAGLASAAVHAAGTAGRPGLPPVPRSGPVP
ncbi:universal stress protein [Nakamurella endophytica]|uniref:UspA domain-containing protein n=1 Tax=Nakamurella endophytica TaxID=1748367 RepID=A0A917T5P0_9ACTN|nr:universal stress protein [Nakamurella endophytica]GGM09037.1 hypothetical protein GCM10011594_31180 [Nakamurella endophytica]